jgi:MoaA/NifB/PqqE/SkfB family radical SAM enzyme
MTNILLFPTMRCNLTCDYCHFRVDQHAKDYEWEGYGKNHRVEKEAEWQDIVSFLATLGECHVEFSGGEPLIYKGFKDIVANLHEGARWAITSNTLVDPSGIDLSKCFFWTASYHEQGNREKFIENVKALKERFGLVAVSFVVPFKKTIDVISLAADYKAIMPTVKINLLRELNPGVSWEGTKEWEALSQMRYYGFNVVEDDIPPSYKFDRGWLCHGGEKYLAIMPNGNVYRCYSEAMDGEPVGTIWDYKPSDAPYECWRECYGCALDHKSRIAKLIGGNNGQRA